MRARVLLAAAVAASSSLLPSSGAGAVGDGPLHLVSRSATGPGTADGASGWDHAPWFGGVASDDGRYVLFESEASDLVEPAQPSYREVYRYDAVEDRVELVTSTIDGNRAGGHDATMSDDGRFVAFLSRSGWLRDDRTPVDGTVWVKDVLTGEAVSASDGVGDVLATMTPLLSGSGSHVVFVVVRHDLRHELWRFDRASGEVEPVLVPSGDDETGGFTVPLLLSDDGEVVVFESDATDVVPGDANGERDSFALDLRTGAITVLTAGPDGHPVGHEARAIGLSDDGTTALVNGSASALLGEDGGRTTLVAVDLASGAREDVARDELGLPTPSYHTPAISHDGQVVAYNGYARTGDMQVFRHDRRTGHVDLVSAVPGTGAAGNGDSWDPRMSDDGAAVYFRSEATDLRPDDVNGATSDILRWDASTGGLLVVHADDRVEPEHGGAVVRYRISGDGRAAWLETADPSLAAGDDNGAADVFGWFVDDVRSELSVDDVVAEEGATRSTWRFTVRLSAPATRTVTVGYTTRNRDAFDQARKGSDYLAAAGVLTIPAGRTTASIEVTVLGDRVPELDEPFEVVLFSPLGASIADGTATGVLVNDDPVRLPR